MTTAKKTTTAKTTETLEAVAVEQQKKLEDAVKAGAEAFSQGYEQVYATTKDQMDKVNEFAFKNYDELADFNKETIEAVMASSNVVAKGVEDFGQEIASYAQQAAEKNIEAAKKMFAVKSMQDAMDLQAEWAKMAFDSFMAESAKLQDMSMQVGTKAAEPLNKQVNAAVEKFSKPITA
jgi:phasin family protein